MQTHAKPILTCPYTFIWKKIIRLFSASKLFSQCFMQGLNSSFY